MKSYIFATDNDRGGVILCDIETLEEAVGYLQQRFKGVVRVEQGRKYWADGEGYGELEPLKPEATHSG
ncbi:hypothetical protein [Marinobacterium sediminicola]|uniref:Uncharacterized protein n=1 Tax=Marinobacterium sediminicola TaxID=518898 RepID=A0ABY1RWX6_9GAMM|nr:hypothetical protein [Marinobacterium sediminicola]ULG67931.1 hypothetical protein LN244_09390 [Marinobacterium sediminicola]SMR71336.1 hypothetical protein SAMN04487964_10237 [Marinobacterium sediminicola]